MEHLDDVDCILEEVVTNFRLEMSRKDAEELVDLVLLACMDKIVVILLEESDQLAAYLVIEVNLCNEVLDDLLFRLVFALAFDLREDAGQPRKDVVVHCDSYEHLNYSCYHFEIVSRSNVSIANCTDCHYGPVTRRDVSRSDRVVEEALISDPIISLHISL